MSIKLADAIVYFRGDKAQLQQAQQESDQETRSWVSRLGGVIRTSLATAATAAGAAITGALVGAGKLALDAMPIEGLADAFYSMSDGAKLAALRVGSLNTVTDAELMRSYNSAAMLVSETFADQLPDAMSYFGKISAATGDDIGFLMNSYVTGVGRLSPMILDNLKIQVDANKAYEDYAAKMGIATSAMTKEQQQMALSEQVLALLAERTASMGDISENASVKAAQLQAMLGNLKDQIGVALLPALTALMAPLAELMTTYGPGLVEFAQQAGEWLGENLPRAIGGLAALFSGDAQTAISNFGAIIYSTFGPEAASKFLEITGWLQEKIPLALATLQEIWQTVFPIIQQKIEEWWPVIQDVLAQIGAWFTTEGPTALTTLESAWNTVWGTIQTVIGAVSGFIQERLGAMKAWWDEHGSSIRTIVDAAMNAIQVVIALVMGGIQTFWNNWGDEIKAITSNIWDTLKAIVDGGMTIIGEVIDAIAALIKGDWDSFGESLRTIWDTLWSTIGTIVDNGIDSVMQFIHGLIDDVKGAFDIDWGELGTRIIDGIKNGISNGISSIKDAAKNAAQSALDAAKDLLGIESPSKAFEWVGQMTSLGMERGILDMAGAPARAIRQVAEGMTNAGQQTVQQQNNNYYLQPTYLDRDSQPSLAATVRGLQILTQA